MIKFRLRRTRHEAVCYAAKPSPRSRVQSNLHRARPRSEGSRVRSALARNKAPCIRSAPRPLQNDMPHSSIVAAQPYGKAQVVRLASRLLRIGAQSNLYRARYAASNKIRSGAVLKICNGIKSYAASNEIRSAAGE